MKGEEERSCLAFPEFFLSEFLQWSVWNLMSEFKIFFSCKLNKAYQKIFIDPYLIYQFHYNWKPLKKYLNKYGNLRIIFEMSEKRDKAKYGTMHCSEICFKIPKQILH